MLENWLSKVCPEITSAISDLSPESIGQGIKIYKSLFPDLNDCQIVILSDNSEDMDKIRLQFYEMYHHLDNLYLADIGNLRNTDTNFLISLFTELLESKLLPIVITTNEEIIHTFHFALNSFHNKFESLYCGKRISKMSKLDYANCQKITSLGIQGHLNALDDLSEDDIVRLAAIKGNIEESEPFTRNVDTIIFNLNCIKHSEIIGYQDASPSGLDADEVTQLFRYFGFNDNLKGLFIYGYNGKYDFNHQTSQLISQVLWYFTEAKNHCITENITSTEDFHEFVVDLEGLDDPITFIKAKKSGRWWLKSVDNEKLIPCSYKDYLMACQNEIPDRIIKL